VIPIILSFFIEGGLLFNGGAGLYEDDVLQDRVSLEQTYYTEIGCELRLSYLFVGGGIYTATWKSEDSHTFFPYATNYNFTAGLDFDWLRAGYEHNCFHPVSPGFLIHNGVNGSQDRLYVRINAEVKLN
jgi:hypothetical protein